MKELFKIFGIFGTSLAVTLIIWLVTGNNTVTTITGMQVLMFCIIMNRLDEKNKNECDLS